jgi:type I restriction enzyme S subunit
MIEGLRPYPEMAATGHAWLPSIPASWEVRRNGRLFSERRETGYPDLPILEVSLRSGVRVRDMKGGKRKQQIADRSVYQRAVKGDIAYNMMRMWQGAVGIAPTDGLVSPAYVVAKAHDGVDAAYYAYLFRTDDYLREIDSFSRGIVPDRNRLYWQAFKQMPSAFPPLDEQRLIVRFLDWHGAMTGKLIRAKRRLIALLNEQKQSIIHRAITRGLDPAAKLKPSGVDWFTEVPEHWQVVRLKRVCRFEYGDALASDKRVDGVVDVYGSNGPVGRHDVSNTDAPAIVVGRKGSFGKVNWSDTPVFVIDTAYHVPIATSRTNVRWLFHALSSAKLDTISNDTAIPGLSREDAYSRMLPLPPSMDEQAAIAASIDDVTVEANEAIKLVQAEIVLIQEFRTRLISDVVTGQLDVRAVAASLPDLTETEAFADTTDDMEDEDEDAFDVETEDA